MRESQTAPPNKPDAPNPAIPPWFQLGSHGRGVGDPERCGITHMTIHDVFAKVSPRFRRRRMADFMARFRPYRGTRILDVGGYPAFWAETSTEAHITILNIHPFEVTGAMQDRCAAVVGDGTNLPFKDGGFDIVFSNSVIEHLRNWEAQQQFAREVRHVGRRYWVQTPAHEFFVEPHLLTPCVHWLPYG
jgi:hypothetical protein